MIDSLRIANTSGLLLQNYYQSHVTNIQFTDANDSNDRDITVEVTIFGDNVYNNWGEISIALADSVSKQYTSDPNNNSAKVSIREDEQSQISVAIEVSDSVAGR